MNKTDYKDMWVFIERDGDSVLPVSLELCSETRKLCDASGEKLVAVIVGSISDGELQRVLDCGVDKVIHVTGTGYDYFNNDAYTNLFTVLCRKYRPTAVMVGGTINGRDFAPRFAARLGTGCTSDATELVWDPKTTDIEFVEPAVGGKMMAVITVPVARPQVGTIRPGTFKCVPCGARAHELPDEARKRNLRAGFVDDGLFGEFVEHGPGLVVRDLVLVLGMRDAASASLDREKALVAHGSHAHRAVPVAAEVALSVAHGAAELPPAVRLHEKLAFDFNAHDSGPSIPFSALRAPRARSARVRGDFRALRRPSRSSACRARACGRPSSTAGSG